MRDRIRAATTAALGVAMLWTAMGIAPVAAAAPLKVVIIVGPTGSLTDNYRATGNSIAEVAANAGAEVVKVYSPKATWPRVRNAVAGANIVVYLGHGNGYPNPYSTGTEWTDRANGWGLNRTLDGGDGDNWSKDMVYCGEKAILGTLTASDGDAQWRYCGGKNNTDGIAPAANWVMIYNKACYAPGASEGWDTKATESKAFEHVRNYSYPALKKGAGAYFATDMYHGAEQLVDSVLRNREMTFGEIAESANGYELAAQRRFDHPDVVGREVWIQRTNTSMGADYWYAYAGRPNLTPSGENGVYVAPAPPVVAATSPQAGAINAGTGTVVTATFEEPVAGVSAGSVKLTDAYGLSISGTVTYNSTTFTARFTPSQPLEPGMRYKATLTSGIRNVMGEHMVPTSWTFTVTGTLGGGTTAFAPATALDLGAGTNTGYKFTAAGAMVAAKHATLAGPTSATTTLRRTITNQAGRWFYVATGTWKGFWLRESSGVALSGGTIATLHDPQTFDPERTVLARKGTHTGYQFDGGGAMTAAKTITVNYREASTSELMALPGQTGLWFHVTSGSWTDYWLRSSDVVTLLEE